MTEAKHTPGTWHFEPDGMGDFTIASRNGPLAIAAVVNGQVRRPEEHDANARLITAAPDMLGALKSVRARFQHLRLGPDEEMVLNRVSAAIAKATAV
jgi:hypothetical protein